MKHSRITDIAELSFLRTIKIWHLLNTFILLVAGLTGLLNWWLNKSYLSVFSANELSLLASINLILLAAALSLLKQGQTKASKLIIKGLALSVVALSGVNLLSNFNREISVIFMTANCALLFLTGGLALLSWCYKKAYLSQSISLITASIALLSLIGHVHNMPEFYVPFQDSFIPIIVTVSFLLFSASMLLAGKNSGYMAEITSPYSGGRIARRLLPMLLLTPFILEFIRLYGERSGLYSPASGIVLFFCAVLIIFLFTILNSVKLANRIDLDLEAEIDERQKAETELKSRNLFLKTVLENIPNMIFVKKGKELRFEALNRAGENLLGVPREEYIGKTDEDLFPKEQAEAFKQTDLEVFKNEKVVIIEAEEVNTKYGNRWLRTKKIPVKDEDGSPLYIVGISEDITEKRKQDEKIKQFYAELEQKVKERTEELSNSEKRFRALIENSTDGITITNAESVIIYESPAVERMTDYLFEEKIGTSLFDHINSEDVEKCKKLYTELSANPGTPILGQFRLLKKNGDYIWIEGTATNLICDESVKAIVFNYRDVTERKSHEHERELLIKELTIHNKGLRQFSYITSHNLRAPVSNLLGLLNLIKYTPIEDPSLKEIIQGFSASTNSLNDTINDLLNALYIKENTGIEQEDINIDTLFSKVLGQVSNLIIEIEPEIETNINPESIIYFNKVYLESIFLNLTTNALKYRSKNRRLKLTIKLEEFKDKTVITFKDNGIGLDLEKCGAKIFGLYQRFHNHPDSKGLGLYLVKTHMEALGGNIEIESAIDAGTKFILTFNKVYAEQSSFH